MLRGWEERRSGKVQCVTHASWGRRPSWRRRPPCQCGRRAGKKEQRAKWFSCQNCDHLSYSVTFLETIVTWKNAFCGASSHSGAIEPASRNDRSNSSSIVGCGGFLRKENNTFIGRFPLGNGGRTVWWCWSVLIDMKMRVKSFSLDTPRYPYRARRHSVLVNVIGK